MITASPTENLTGITIQGDFDDFNELVDSIYRLTATDEEKTDYYFGAKSRLLGVCYEIRHTCMGDRDIILKDNGMTSEKMGWHNKITPTQNVYYSVNILFPEAIFIAASASSMCSLSFLNYGIRGRARAEHKYAPSFSFSNYIRDKANLHNLCTGIWQALGEVIGDEELENIYRLRERTDEDYMDYVTHYIDKCNIELIDTAVEKRKDKLRNLAKRIIKKPQGYKSMEYDLNYWAKEYKTTIYELYDSKLEYPEDIEW